LVDDEPLITTTLKRVLRKEPYDICTANSGAEALQILARKPVDVIVSDERMPGMSGSEFLAVARQQYPDTARIILTGQANLEAAIRAINEGAICRFLTKPCKEDDLTPRDR
jgi:response regulator RpfG family c-di-GMP phosphodiesterase